MDAIPASPAVPPTAPVRVIGSYLSPYVRKVLVCLHEKDIPYEIDPIVPFFGDERFSRLSPVRRIPVLIDDAVTLCDSSVICQYLEDRHPTPPLYPQDVAARAQARWLEEYADTRMGDVFIWRLFNQHVIAPFVWGEATDRAVVDRTVAEDVPEVLAYLETRAPADGFLFGPFSIADVSVAVFFRNAAWARFTIDATRWPRTAGLVARVLARESFVRLRPFEETSLRTPLLQQRDALRAAGAPIMAETYGTATPRRGVMRV
jgi:glutathione S-transferase